MGDVTVQKFDGTQQKVSNWTMTGYPLTEYNDDNDDSSSINEEEHSDTSDIYLHEGPIVFAGEFSIPTDRQINDTYVDPSGWGKVSSQI